MTPKEIRTKLANNYGADYVCPVTTGIALRIVAEAANEALEHGAPIDDVTSVWRVLDKQASVLKKLCFDQAFILDQRTRERPSTRCSRTGRHPIPVAYCSH